MHNGGGSCGTILRVVRVGNFFHGFFQSQTRHPIALAEKRHHPHGLPGIAIAVPTVLCPAMRSKAMFADLDVHLTQQTKKYRWGRTAHNGKCMLEQVQVDFVALPQECDELCASSCFDFWLQVVLLRCRSLGRVANTAVALRMYTAWWPRECLFFQGISPLILWIPAVKHHILHSQWFPMRRCDKFSSFITWVTWVGPQAMANGKAEQLLADAASYQQAFAKRSADELPQERLCGSLWVFGHFGILWDSI